MNKYLVIVKPYPDKETTIDQVIEADGFERTDFDLIFWRRDFMGGKNNSAFYQTTHVVCAVLMEKESMVSKLHPME